ncbi:MAG TPA: hypothetical protein VGI59_10465 [Candidatus Udaeobacter sp.]
MERARRIYRSTRYRRFYFDGRPFIDEGGSMLTVNADDENEVREKLKTDPWMKHGVLKLDSVKRWQIFIDVRK